MEADMIERTKIKAARRKEAEGHKALVCRRRPL
jgi:hypothetical protein